MSMDWWFNFNHMEGLTDRCYRVTVSSESQSRDSLWGNEVFLKEKGMKTGAGAKKHRIPIMWCFLSSRSLSFSCYSLVIFSPFKSIWTSMSPYFCLACVIIEGWKRLVLEDGVACWVSEENGEFNVSKLCSSWYRQPHFCLHSGWI